MAKRKCGDAEATTSLQKSPPKRQRKPFSLPAWSDIPNWQTNATPILDIPVELLDKIFSPESELALQDHLALAGTCRRIRAAYTDEVWKALAHSYVWSPNRNIAWRIFSAALLNQNHNHSSEDASAIPAVAAGDDHQIVQPSIRTQIADELKRTTITASLARSDYKGCLSLSILGSISDGSFSQQLTEMEVLSLPFETRPNPHRRSAPMKLFCRARVYALAMRVHGGPLGHLAHLKKLAERDAKAKSTRVKNGTTPVKKPKAVSGYFMTPLYPDMLFAEPDDYAYDDY